jgi:putative membrane protein
MADTSRTDLATILLIGLGILILSPMLMMGFAMPMMGGMYGYGGQGTFGLVGLLVPLAVLLVVLGAGYHLVRRVTDSAGSRDAALEELRSAYARGDLSDEEFETRRRKLQNE